MTSTGEWIDSRTLLFEGSTFVTGLGTPQDQSAGSLAIAKQPRTIVELGIKRGGSTALLALVADPDLLVALDLEPEIPPLLAGFIQSHGLGSRVVTAFGVDQGDRSTVSRFVDEHQPEGGFDLVIDDASHRLAPTRASFEVLFPRLRPGGSYVIEDWTSDWEAATFLARSHPSAADLGDRLRRINYTFTRINDPENGYPAELLARIDEAAAAAHSAQTYDAPRSFLESVAAALERPDIAADFAELDGAGPDSMRPLSDLAVELTMIRAWQPDVIADVRLDGDWVTVRRGPAELSADSFRLDDQWTDAYGYLPSI
jgi:Methyltransferase domain